MGNYQQETEHCPIKGDPQLIAEVRAGNIGAFDELYRRHVGVGRSVALAQADNVNDAEDIVAEAFAAVFTSLSAGKGPDEFFRAYLLTVVRRMAHVRNRQANRTATGHNGELDTVEAEDPIVSAFESTTVARAFKSLPERWQAVLWYMDVEQLKPAAAARHIGISANGCSSLLIRAREALRQAYLQHHIHLPENDPCAGYASQLGKYARNKLSRNASARLESHLEQCAKCTAILADLTDIQSAMRTAIFPLLTGLAAKEAERNGIIPAGPPQTIAAGPVSWTVAGSLKAAAAVILLGGAALTATSTVFTAGEDSLHTVQASTTPIPVRAFQGPSVERGDASPHQPIGPAPKSLTRPEPEPDNVPVPVTPDYPTPRQLPAVPPESGPVPTWAPVPQTKLPAAAPERPKALAGPPETTTQAVPTKKPEVPLPAPTVTPPAPEITKPPLVEMVTMEFSMTEGAAGSQRELHALFHLREDYTPGTAKIVFELSAASQFIPWKVQFPAGWSCTEDPGGAKIACATDSPPARDLAFDLGASGMDSGETATLLAVFTSDDDALWQFRAGFL